MFCRVCQCMCFSSINVPNCFHVFCSHDCANTFIHSLKESKSSILDTLLVVGGIVILSMLPATPNRKIYLGAKL